MWYKAEAFVASEHAGKHLYDNGLTPIYVSDNPVLNAQHVLFEAAKAYRFGLPYHAALASVTTAPAERLGLGKRLGKVKPGFDADVVVWDSDPLSVGATPVQVWIDGTAQFENPIELKKPVADLIVPDERLAEITEEPTLMDEVVFTGVSKLLVTAHRGAGGLSTDGPINVVFSKGKITCIGTCVSEMRALSQPKTPIIKLKNGYVTESLTAFGSTLGLNAIDAEDVTDNGNDGNVFSRGEDGLMLDSKKLHVSYKYGVTKAISAPMFRRQESHHGTSVGFLTGASTVLENGTVFASDVAVHYTLTPAAKSEETPSISSAVGALRRKLLEAAKLKESPVDAYSESAFLQRVVNGSLPLAITVHSADAIAAILKVKAAVEAETKSSIRVVIVGGAESWLVADELAAAGVGVVLAPLQSYATSWDQKRALPGAPLTNGTCIDKLLDAGVLTAIGTPGDFLVYELALLAGTSYWNGGGRLSEKEALDLLSANIYKLFDLEEPSVKEGHFVVYEGHPLDIGSRVKAVAGGTSQISVY